MSYNYDYDYFDRKRDESYDIFADDEYDYEFSDELFYENGYIDEYGDYDY